VRRSDRVTTFDWGRSKFVVGKAVMADPKHTSVFRTSFGGEVRPLVRRCTASRIEVRGPGQPFDAARMADPTDPSTDPSTELLRHELDADELAMASLVEAVHWLRVARSPRA
jgi:hypothetical protein